MDIINNVLIWTSPLIIWGALEIIDYITEARATDSGHLTEDEPCGYCGTSQDPNDMCIDCWNGMQGQPEAPHTDMCQEYWDRGLECQCIPFAVAQDLRNGARPEDVM